ncbi:hypothetical protein [Novacetimonas hansenii]|uniref:Uncharacterized protein n=1 Tax=Novacetimonas hansenii TaxID=436 RepID=A0ABQ0SGT6_NOVHA|nr:hypothetical protein [Novacetimonas hansenii]GAN84009.1 hypothetical protein Gaha_0122_009 [Novacetimonas hansenii JCM 7643]GBQ55916.1 hypothetical protein AA0243_1051 [Novacetimonas hansenii NRIC 0243]GEC64589.1 hypothetical protein GHA01_24380 [Novacetimonas hansenii]
MDLFDVIRLPLTYKDHFKIHYKDFFDKKIPHLTYNGPEEVWFDKKTACTNHYLITAYFGTELDIEFYVTETDFFFCNLSYNKPNPEYIFLNILNYYEEVFDENMNIDCIEYPTMFEVDFENCNKGIEYQILATYWADEGGTIYGGTFSDEGITNINDPIIKQKLKDLI